MVEIHWSHAISIFNPHESWGAKKRNGWNVYTFIVREDGGRESENDSDSQRKSERKEKHSQWSFIFIDIIRCLVPVRNGNKFDVSL